MRAGFRSLRRRAQIPGRSYPHAEQCRAYGFGVRYTFSELSKDTYFAPAMRCAVSVAGDPAKRNISEPQIAPDIQPRRARAVVPHLPSKL